jgi:uncharacterized membrane protein YfcA
MEVATLLLLFAGGFVSGAITAIAGGGSFLTFPMLLAAGLPPMAANITNWVALMPGNFMALAAYRTELAEMRHEVRPHLLVAFFGGLAGSLLLLWTGEVRFEKAVPWLMLTATLFFALGEWVKKRLHAWRKPDKPVPQRAILAFEFVLMVYGGFFGAGLGIVLLAALAMAGEKSMHKANAKKNLMVAALSIAGLIVFLPSGKVFWAYAIPILIASGLGGYSAVYLVRRVPQHVLRLAVLTWAIVLTAVMFWKYG